MFFNPQSEIHNPQWIGTDIMRRAIALAAIAATSMGLANHAFADDEAEAAERLAFMKKSVTVYEVMPHSPIARLTKPYIVQSEPLLRWNNPVSSSPDGALFLWLDETGRPAIAAQAFIAGGTKDLWLHEFQSLSMFPFIMKRDSAVVWSPAKAGVAMKPLPDAPAPAPSKPLRMSQMRELARRFEAFDDFQGSSRWELRLLTTPLHRYGGEDHPAADGALFAFAHGTDPEVLLLLEARRNEEALAWHYGLAPMTGYALQVKDRGDLVWSAEHRKPPFATDQPFYILKYVP